MIIFVGSKLIICPT